MQGDRREERILALDVGRKRIGLAFSDGVWGAVALDAMQRKTMREDARRLSAMAKERKAAFFLMGLPLHMNGEEGEMAAFVRTFGVRLEEESGLKVVYLDERLTSVEAEARLKERGLSLKRMLDAKRGGAVDSLSAAILLEDYLHTGDTAE
ncbi:MAG: Holliday junction resolvase RuvX [Acidobacteria bacterium]|nr:Holliday junction resolvase RuvX [Acidobacteriota bacterium]